MTEFVGAREAVSPFVLQNLLVDQDFGAVDKRGAENTVTEVTEIGESELNTKGAFDPLFDRYRQREFLQA